MPSPYLPTERALAMLPGIKDDDPVYFYALTETGYEVDVFDRDEFVALIERFGTPRAPDPLLRAMGVRLLVTDEDTGQQMWIIGPNPR